MRDITDRLDAVGNVTKAATKVQTIARGRRDRRRATERAEQQVAAVRVQSVVRGRQSRSLVQDRRAQNAAAIRVQSVPRTFCDLRVAHLGWGVEAMRMTSGEPGKQFTLWFSAPVPDNRLRYPPVSLFFDLSRSWQHTRQVQEHLLDIP